MLAGGLPGSMQGLLHRPPSRPVGPGHACYNLWVLLMVLPLLHSGLKIFVEHFVEILGLQAQHRSGGTQQTNREPAIDKVSRHCTTQSAVDSVAIRAGF